MSQLEKNADDAVFVVLGTPVPALTLKSRILSNEYIYIFS